MSKINILFLLFLFLINTYHPLSAQSLNKNPAGQSLFGFSGLIYTPSAYTSNWGEVYLGWTHYDDKIGYTKFGGREDDERSLWTHIGFLPFAEMSIKLTKPINSSTLESGIGDRSISFRLQVLKETEKRPAILIGVVDPFIQVPIFEARYIVLSKSYQLKQFQLIGNIGYGLKVNKNSRNNDLQGVFGGVQTNWKHIKMNLEYDTNRINIGTGYAFKNRIFLDAALIDLKYFSGSIHARFSIK